MSQRGDGGRGTKWSVLLILLIGSFLISIAFAYVAVVSQNPHASTKPLYGPGDFITSSQ
ncbi:MAG TPA: hypothetical protein VEN82_01605 [Actinomycetota bacterium]|nr:hypothetical protein [Actinomycetota bacterium]